MPVNEDSAHLNEQLGEWFRTKSPEFLEGVSGHQFHEFLRTLIDVKDVYLACRLVERFSGVKPDEDLIALLLTNYNEYTLDKLERLKLMERR
jgi:hypothetical protein